MKYENIVNIEFMYRDSAKTDPRFYVSYRDENGKRTTVKDPHLFPSYFYVSDKEANLTENLDNDIKQNLLSVTPGFKSLFGDDLTKISFGKMSKSQFMMARGHFMKTFEDDVLYSYRYIIDKKVKYTKNQRILYFDIETLMSLDIENTPQPIISIAAYDTHYKKYFYFFYHPDCEEGKRTKDNLNVYYFKKEEDMLANFMKFFRTINPDIVTGWNCDWFDVPYLLNRIRKVGLNQNQISTFNKAYCIVGQDQDRTRSKIYGCSIVDLKKVYEKLTYDNKPDSYSLSTVARHTLGEDKVEHDGIKKMWETPELWEQLEEYNIKDVELCVKIDEMNNLMNYFLTVQEIIPIPADDILMNSRVVDMFFLQKCRGKYILPSKKRQVKEKFPGAFTGKLTKITDETIIQMIINSDDPYILEGEALWHGEAPEAKVHNNIVVFDFGSMYPSIYRTFNISPETLDKNGEINIGGVRFTNKIKGLIPTILEELLLERKKLQKERDAIEDASSAQYFALENKQGALKAIINSIYGIMGYENFRLYNIDIGKSITYMGRLLLIVLDKVIRKMGYETIYSDTDSSFVKFPDNMSKEDILKESQRMQDLIHEELERFAKEIGSIKSYLEVEYEKLFSSVLFRGVKKQYFGRLTYYKGHDTDKMFSRGMEIVRRDTPRVLKPLMEKLYTSILNQEDMRDVKVYLVEELKKLQHVSAWEIGSTKRLSKNFGPKPSESIVPTPDQYKSNNLPNVRACMFSNLFLGTNWQKADYAKIIYVNVNPPPHMKAAIEKYLSEYGFQEVDCIAVDENTKIPDWIEIDYEKMFETFVYAKLRLCENVKGVEIRRLYSKNMMLSDFFNLEAEN